MTDLTEKTLATERKYTGKIISVDLLDPWCGWHDFHAIKVNGKQSKITDDDLLVVAEPSNSPLLETAPRASRATRRSR